MVVFSRMSSRASPNQPASIQLFAKLTDGKTFTTRRSGRPRADAATPRQERKPNREQRHRCFSEESQPHYTVSESGLLEDSRVHLPFRWTRKCGHPEGKAAARQQPDASALGRTPCGHAKRVSNRKPRAMTTNRHVLNAMRVQLLDGKDNRNLRASNF